MRWKRFVLVVIGFFLFSGTFYVYGQYTGFDLERKSPATLFPKPGPGETAIVNELRQTNKLLELNNQLLQDQNRLLRELLAHPKSDQKK